MHRERGVNGDMDMKIGMIGLGGMGVNMVRSRLLQDGHRGSREHPFGFQGG
ncbi:MAG: hypothetical protein U5N86_07330 [Planctomycetota bacterium]|nr:hypothetical protein [Planctomycetota bacterium]